MAQQRFLSDRFTPAFLMGLCEGRTDFQSQDDLRPFIGQWIRATGVLEHATPNPTFETAGVTIAFPGDDNQRRDAFLWFTRNLDQLAKMGVGDPITIEGQIKSISSHTMALQDCGLADPQIVSILKVKEAAKELQKAVEDRVASNEPITLKPARPKSQPDPTPSADKRKNPPSGEAERFCRLLLAGWPNTTERDAYKKAAAFFSENRVPKHSFLDIFRAIRGDRKPGPQPKNGN